MCLEDLAVTILEHHRAAAMKDPGRAPGEGRRVAAGRDPVARRLGNGQPDGRLADEPIEQADGIRSAPDAGEREVGQTTLQLVELRCRFVADPTLEVTDDRRVRMRTHR